MTRKVFLSGGGGGVEEVGVNVGGGVVVVGVVVMWLKMNCVVGGGGGGWVKLLCRCNSSAVQKKVLAPHGQEALEQEKIPTP